MRHASARHRSRLSADATARRDAETFTIAQRIARYGITVVALVLTSLLFATQIQAMLH